MYAFLCLVLGCAGPGWPEIYRLRHEATCTSVGGVWQVDSNAPTEVRDLEHFRALLRDPRPKSLIIDDWIGHPREHAILCGDIRHDDIQVKRLALRVHHVSRSLAQAIDCLDPLPIEYLTLDAYGSSECDPLDLEALFRKLDLRGLALEGYQIGSPIKPVVAGQLEELHIIHSHSANRASWEEERIAFMEIVGSISSLRTLVFYGSSPGWTVEQLRPLTHLTHLTRLELDQDAPAEAIALLVSSLPALERMKVPHRADDSVAAALALSPHLQALQLGSTHMTDDGMTSITRAPELKELVLIETAFSDRALSGLGAMTKLERLHIDNQKHAMRDSIVAISRLPHLDEIELNWTEVDPQILEHLGNLTQLRTLRIANKLPLACDAIRFLERLPHLESLQINMEPECLPYVRQMKHLRVLDIVDDYYPGRPSSRVITGPLAANIAGLPIERLTIGLFDDAAARQLGKLKKLRELRASYDRLSPGVRRWFNAVRGVRDRARARH